VKRLVLSHIRGRAFGVFGEPVVHVLTLNMALDNLR
jgi:K+-transporting ATPase c subunit